MPDSDAVSDFRFDDSPRGSTTGDFVVQVSAGITRRRQLFQELSRQLRFPAYFGQNWDALEECLRDLTWLEDQRAVYLVHLDLPFRAGSSNRQTYLKLLLDVAARRDPTLVQVIPVFPAGLQPEVARELFE